MDDSDLEERRPLEPMVFGKKVPFLHDRSFFLTIGHVTVKIEHADFGDWHGCAIFDFDRETRVTTDGKSSPHEAATELERLLRTLQAEIRDLPEAPVANDSDERFAVKYQRLGAWLSRYFSDAAELLNADRAKVLFELLDFGR
jgi:hypothetical protein